MLNPGTTGRLTAPLGYARPLNETLLGEKAEVAGFLFETEHGPVYLFKTGVGSGEYRGYEWEFTPGGRVAGGTPTLDAAARAKALGYDDSPCPRCGAFKMKRNGNCLCCDDCGETSGCG